MASMSLVSKIKKKKGVVGVGVGKNGRLVVYVADAEAAEEVMALVGDEADVKIVGQLVALEKHKYGE